LLDLAGLAHLFLLISSSYISMPALIPAVHLFEIRGRRGLAKRPMDQIVSYCVQLPSITPGCREPAQTHGVT
jgi:hypothetical protein